MMGEVVGKAASLCAVHQCSPREVYQKYLPELKGLLQLSRWFSPPQHWRKVDDSRCSNRGATQASGREPRHLTEKDHRDRNRRCFNNANGNMEHGDGSKRLYWKTTMFTPARIPTLRFDLLGNRRKTHDAKSDSPIGTSKPNPKGTDYH